VGVWAKRGRALGSCALLACSLFACSGAPAHRVVSISQATTRVAQAMGLGAELATLDPNDPKVLEAAFDSRANLVISDASSASAQIRAAFAARMIAVRVFSPVSTSDALTAYTEIATVLGQPKAAGEMIDRVTHEISAHPIARSDGGPLHLALVASRKPLRIVGKDAFLSRLLQGAGVENVFSSEAGVTVAVQPDQLDARRPDRVLDLAPGTLEGAWVDPAGAVAAVLRALQ